MTVIEVFLFSVFPVIFSGLALFHLFKGKDKSLTKALLFLAATDVLLSLLFTMPLQTLKANIIPIPDKENLGLLLSFIASALIFVISFIGNATIFTLGPITEVDKQTGQRRTYLESQLRTRFTDWHTVNRFGFHIQIGDKESIYEDAEISFWLADKTIHAIYNDPGLIDYSLYSLRTEVDYLSVIGDKMKEIFANHVWPHYAKALGDPYVPAATRETLIREMADSFCAHLSKAIRLEKPFEIQMVVFTRKIRENLSISVRISAETANNEKNCDTELHTLPVSA